MNRKPIYATNAGTFRHLPSRRFSQGVGLIEVLIAVLVMGIGMLGIAAMQATSLRNSQSSFERTNAVIQSYAILDAMRANLQGVKNGEYNIAGLKCSASGSPTTLAAADIDTWINSTKAMLGTAESPGSAVTTTCGQINCTPVATPGTGNLCTVVVQWDDSRGSYNETSTEEQVRIYKVSTVALL